MGKTAEILAGMEHCLVSGVCRECPYQALEDAYRAGGTNPNGTPITCIDIMIRGAADALRAALPEAPARLMSLEELLDGWGCGWEETWLIGDDEEPERIDLEACVWIDGHVMLASGSTGDARGYYWQEHYGRKYGIRVWAGRGEIPTMEQRQHTPWAEPGEPKAEPAEEE